MNPQLLQSIKLMEMPLADLREKIEQELERNPALKIHELIMTKKGICKYSTFHITEINFA